MTWIALGILIVAALTLVAISWQLGRISEQLLGVGQLLATLHQDLTVMQE